MPYRKEIIDRVKEAYPEGTRILLVQMKDDPYPVPPKTKGTVQSVDDLGQIQMHWDNGSTLALIEGLDEFTIIKEED